MNLVGKRSEKRDRVQRQNPNLLDSDGNFPSLKQILDITELQVKEWQKKEITMKFWV